MEKKTIIIISSVAAAVVILGGGAATYYTMTQTDAGKAKRVAKNYVANFKAQKFDQVLKDAEAKTVKAYKLKASQPAADMKADFKYFDVTKIDVGALKTKKNSLGNYTFQFTATLTTPIGKIKDQTYSIPVKIVDGKAKIQYSPSLILPDLKKGTDVYIAKDGGERGQILDRNGEVLAGSVETKELQIVPKYFLDAQGNIDETKVDAIATKYNASADDIKKGIEDYKDHPDWGYPVKTLGADDYQGDDDGDGATVVANYQRNYPLGAAAAQLIGYTGAVTKEDIDKDPLLGSNDIIGRDGLELTLDSKLRGKEAIKYQIIDKNGTVIKNLVEQKFVKGQDIKLTIDANVQKNAYEGFNNVPGSAVIESPATGELLALASSPSYDPNTLSENYNSISSNPDAPFIARYTKGYAPASTFKQVTAAIGLDNGTLNPSEALTIEGKKWAEYSVTRVNSDTSVNLQTALWHSDNIYFAKQALKIGRETFQDALLKKFTFGKDYDLPIAMKAPSFSNDGKLDSDKQLADTAYGQGQMSVNPIEMVTMYNFLDNDGTIVMPKLLLDAKTTKIENAVKPENAKIILDDEVGVVENSDGYAHNLYNANYKIGAKTGTAEVGNGNQNSLVSVHDIQNKKFSALFIVENSVVDGNEHNPLADHVSKQVVDYLENN